VCKNPAITLVEACSRNHPFPSAPGFIVKGAFLWIDSGHQVLVKISLPYKCHRKAVCTEAISCFPGISSQKRIATPPHLPWRAVPGKSKSGGSQ